LGDIIDLIAGFAKKNAKVFIALLLIALVLVLILFPNIDANSLMLNRISARIDIIDKVSKLESETINQDPRLQQEYEAILNEVQGLQEKSIGLMTVQRQTPNDYNIKFVSGGLLFWGIGIAVLFQKAKNSTSPRASNLLNKIGGFVLCGLFGGLCAIIATNIPTLGSVWVNAFLFPAMILAIAGLFVYGRTKKS